MSVVTRPLLTGGSTPNLPAGPGRAATAAADGTRHPNEGASLLELLTPLPDLQRAGKNGTWGPPAPRDDHRVPRAGDDAGYPPRYRQPDLHSRGLPRRVDRRHPLIRSAGQPQPFLLTPMRQLGPILVCHRRGAVDETGMRETDEQR